VVDGGRARRAQFDPSSGHVAAVTARDRAEATRRAGVGAWYPKDASSFWTRGEEACALPPTPPGPRSRRAIYVPLRWNWRLEAHRPSDLKFVTRPTKAGSGRGAQSVLALLGAPGSLDVAAYSPAMPRYWPKMRLHPRPGPYGMPRADAAPRPLRRILSDCTLCAAALSIWAASDAFAGKTCSAEGQPRRPCPHFKQDANGWTRGQTGIGPTTLGCSHARLSRTESRCGAKGTRRGFSPLGPGRKARYCAMVIPLGRGKFAGGDRP